MSYHTDYKQTRNSQRLRKEMTKEERHLWYDFLRLLPVRVNRQRKIGPYIADFYCSEARLVIELDGSQHYEDTEMEYDKQRDSYMNANGITVLRYSNGDVNYNFNGVCDDILKHMPERIRKEYLDE